MASARESVDPSMGLVRMMGRKWEERDMNDIETLVGMPA
jgi:hypothetical protein